MPTKKQPAAEPQATLVAYKGFEADWKCRGFQYALGETFEHKGKVQACKSGFHACERPLDVLAYYPPAGSRFAVVEQSGELARHEEDGKAKAALYRRALLLACGGDGDQLAYFVSEAGSQS